MAWVAGSTDEKWDALVHGVEWHRANGEYYFFIDEAAFAAAEAASPAISPADAQLHQGDAHSPEWWRSNCAALWLEELVAEEAAQPAGEHADGADANDEHAADAAPGAAQPVAAAPAPPRRLGNPMVTTSVPLRYTADGAFKWVAAFRVAAPQDSLSWIIQKVVLNDEETFYEAFSVSAGATVADDEDVYQCSNQRDWTSDEYKVVGDARQYVFGGSASPPGFTMGAGSADDEQLATEETPAWWEGEEGTAHSLTFTLEPLAITTVPASGTGVRVASLAGLDEPDSDDDEGDSSPAPVGASPAPS
jgi:hypothetical protein